MAVHPKKVQIKRTRTPLPPDDLLPGELSVEMNDPMKLWVGVPADIDAAKRKLLVTGGDFVKRSGDTMAGDLVLFADPTDPMEAATKQYVDAHVGGGGGGTGQEVLYTAQVRTPAERTIARQNVYAAPFDALGYFGMQMNGGMRVNQEKFGLPVAAAGQYICDGFMLARGGSSVVSASQMVSSTSFPGYSNFLLINCTTAQATMNPTDVVCVHHTIEGYRIASLNWGFASPKPITIGFWSAHHRPGLYTGAVRNNAATRSYPFTYTQALADIAQFNVITVPGCVDGVWENTNLAGMWVTFNMALGSSFMAAPGAWANGNFVGATGQVNAVAATSDNFRITGVIILPGNEAPNAERAPLIIRPFPEEYKLCERYYQKSFDHEVAPGFAAGLAGSWVCVPATTGAGGGAARIFFGQRMRASPTILTFNTNVADVNWWDSNAATSRLAAVADQCTSGLRILLNGTGNTVGSQHFIHWTANARYS